MSDFFVKHEIVPFHQRNSWIGIQSFPFTCTITTPSEIFLNVILRKSSPCMSLPQLHSCIQIQSTPLALCVNALYIILNVLPNSKTSSFSINILRNFGSIDKKKLSQFWPYFFHWQLKQDINIQRCRSKYNTLNDSQISLLPWSQALLFKKIPRYEDLPKNLNQKPAAMSEY